jgi:hypothetical protein
MSKIIAYELLYFTQNNIVIGTIVLTILLLIIFISVSNKINQDYKLENATVIQELDKSYSPERRQ